MFRLLNFVIISVSSLLLIPSLLYCVPLRITKINVFDQGSFSEDSNSINPSIDLTQGICSREDSNDDGDTDDQGEAVLEDMYDTVLGVTLANETNVTIKVNKFRYLIPNAGDGNKFISESLAPSSAAEIPPGESKEVFFLFLKNKDGGKSLTREDFLLPTTLGFTNLRVIVSSKDSLGQRFRVRGVTAVSFGDFDRCE